MEPARAVGIAGQLPTAQPVELGDQREEAVSHRVDVRRERRNLFGEVFDEVGVRLARIDRGRRRRGNGGVPLGGGVRRSCRVGRVPLGGGLWQRIGRVGVDRTILVRTDQLQRSWLVRQASEAGFVDALVRGVGDLAEQQRDVTHQAPYLWDS